MNAIVGLVHHNPLGKMSPCIQLQWLPTFVVPINAFSQLTDVGITLGPKNGSSYADKKKMV